MMVLRDMTQADLESALNWWLYPSVTPKKIAPVSSEKSLDRDEVQRIVTGQIKSYLDGVPKPVEPKLYEKSWFQSLMIGVGCTIMGSVIGWVVMAHQSQQGHDKEDQKRDIALEIVNQLGPIKKELSGQFDSIRDRLEKQGEDIARLKQANGVAKSNTPPTAPKSIDEFGGLDQRAFTHYLPALYVVLKQQRSIPNRSTVVAIAEKLRRTSDHSPEYWPTLLSFLKIASEGMSSRFAPPPSTRPGVWSNFTAAGPGTSSISGVYMILDGVDFQGPVVFTNCRLRFTEKQNHLPKVTFVNCVFEFPESSDPTPVIRRASQALLAGDIRNATMPAG